MGLSLYAAIAVMPVFGGALFAANAYMFGLRISERLMRTPVGVYAFVLAIATGFVVVAGRVELVRPGGVDPRFLALAIILIPLSAIVPYFCELLISARLADGWTSSPFAGESGDAAANVRDTLKKPGLFLQLAIFTAVCEELLFRGAVLPEVESATSTVAALSASSLLFAFHHISFGPAAVIGKLVSGFTWGFLYLLGATLLVPLAGHLLFQLLVMRRLQRTEAMA